MLSYSLLNFHSVFLVSQLRQYIHDPSYVTELDEIQIKENLTFENFPLWIDDLKSYEVRQFLNLRLSRKNLLEKVQLEKKIVRYRILVRSYLFHVNFEEEISVTRREM